MSTPPTSVDLALPAVAGAIGVTQGSYGDRGNLELVAPDPDDGFWVFWFNGDAVERHSGVRRGHWSAGLHVPTGGRLLSVRIAQVPFGPDFLEVLGRRATAEVHRWYWTPADGFCDGGPVAEQSSAEPARPVPGAGAIETLLVTDAGVEQLVSAVDAYPELSWRAGRLPVGGLVTSLDRSVGSEHAVTLIVSDARAILLHPDDSGSTMAGPLAGHWRTAQIHVVDEDDAIVTGQDTHGRLVIGAISPVDGSARFRWQRSVEPVDDVAACLSTLPTEPGPSPAPAGPVTLELVTRVGGSLHHSRVDVRSPHLRSTGRRIHAGVWT